MKGYVVRLMQKRNERWLVLESHPKLYALPRW